MEVSVEQLAENIIKKDITNVKLISYFKRSTEKTPVFLSVINRNYAEVKPLLNNDLIIGLEPVKSYIFYIDKLENSFYEIYQEKIDFLKDEIWRRKNAKKSLLKKSDALEPEEGSADYDEKLQECINFAKKTIESLDKMELEKEDFNKVIGTYQEKMKEDPCYKFLFYLRNENMIEFNKRVEDNEGLIRRKILSFSEACAPGNAKFLYKQLKDKGIFKEYGPAKNYYITELGLVVDEKLKTLEWKDGEDGNYEKMAEECIQEEEFNKLKACFDF